MKAIIQLFFKFRQFGGDFHRTAVIVFEYFFNSVFGNNPGVAKLIRFLPAQDDACRVKKGIFHELLVRCPALFDLTVKPSHHPASLLV